MGAGQRAAGRQAHRSSTCGEGESVTWRVTPHCQRTRRWQRDQVVVVKRYLVVEPSIPDLVVAAVLGRIRDRRPEGVGIGQDLENRAYVPSASERRNLSVCLFVCLSIGLLRHRLFADMVPPTFETISVIFTIRHLLSRNKTLDKTNFIETVFTYISVSNLYTA